MTALLVALILAQESSCAAVAAAKARADVFDIRGALEGLDAASKAGCRSAQVQATYLRGWIAAREAYRVGGSKESLEDVDAAVASLKGSGETLPAFVLQAAAAAAQSERESLALFIEQAVQLESVRLSAGVSGAPIVTAHEAAGELWLQVHRYDDARLAFRRAAERVGATPRVTLGLARTAVRLNDVPQACAQYRQLLKSWTGAAAPPEIVEARAFAAEARCRQ